MYAGRLVEGCLAEEVPQEPAHPHKVVGRVSAPSRRSICAQASSCVTTQRDPGLLHGATDHAHDRQRLVALPPFGRRIGVAAGFPI
jgi:hypothetical protein